MADELVPVDHQDIEEPLFKAWEGGKSPQTLAREFSLTVKQVEEILDRMLPAFNASSQLRAFKRELRRLEDLSSQFFTIARRDECRDSAHLVARLNERICAMRGFSPINIRVGVNPLAVEAAAQPSSHQKILAALMRLKHGPDWQPPSDGNSENGADRAVDMPSLPVDTEPNR